jgi:hypothetical protein
VPVLRREPSSGMMDDCADLRGGARRFTTDKGEGFQALNLAAWLEHDGEIAARFGLDL